MRLLKLNPWFFVLTFLGVGVLLGFLLLVVWAHDEGTFSYAKLGNLATRFWLLIFRPAFRFREVTGYDNLFFLYFINHLLNTYLLNVVYNAWGICKRLDN